MSNTENASLMAGTRLFLALVLGVFYVTLALFALAAIAVPFMASANPTADELSYADAAMIFGLLAFVFGLIVFFRQLQAIVKSVAAGDPFHAANAKRIALMGWMALAVWVIDAAFIAYDINKSDQADVAIVLADLSGELVMQVLGLALPLTLFILARVFRHGAAMREDLEGTV